MCGVFGLWLHNGQSPDTSTLERMVQSLHHRGPDGHGFVSHAYGAVGNTRLAIIDVAHGKQPFSCTSGRVHVVQNGEIYNYIELKAELEALGAHFFTNSDTEVLLQGYLQWGDDFVDRLRGMFAIAVFDERAQKLTLWRDHIGMKPLYYAAQQNGVMFASEIKAILAAGMQAKPNLTALHHFLSFNYVPSPYTAFEGILELPAGCKLTITPNQITCDKWWQLGASSPMIPASEDEVCDQLRELLRSSTALHLRSDVEVGAFLSGGVDSSCVVGVASTLVNHPIKTFSIGFDDARYDESVFANEAATRFGTEHTINIANPNMIEGWPHAVFFCDQPHGDVSFMPTHEVAKLARTKVKVVLTGDGGDELFAGYDKYVDFAKDDFTTGWQQRYFERTSLLTHNEKMALYSDDMRRRFADLHSFDITKDWQSTYASCEPMQQILAFDSTYLLSGNNLIKPDRMSMAASLEGRMPLLSREMIDFAFALPMHMKLRDGTTKYILKKAFAPLIGEHLAYRKKQMFTVPIGDWLRTSLAPLMQHLLGSNQFAARGLFEQRNVNAMMQAHIKGTENHTRILRALMAIELWFRLFIDSQTIAPPVWENLGIALPKNLV